MKYKGYTGIVEFDEESGVLFGHVIGLRDGITFQGDSVAAVIQAFHDSVDDYLEFCAERGESPEKPYSGQFVLRIDPQLHRVMSHAAVERGASLNSLIEERLKEAFGLAEGGHPATGTEPRKITAAKRAVGTGKARPPAGQREALPRRAGRGLTAAADPSPPGADQGLKSSEGRSGSQKGKSRKVRS